MIYAEHLGNNILLNITFGKKINKLNTNIHSYYAKSTSKLNLLPNITAINDTVCIKFFKFINVVGYTISNQFLSMQNEKNKVGRQYRIDLQC